LRVAAPLFLIAGKLRDHALDSADRATGQQMRHRFDGPATRQDFAGNRDFLV
jgi:hypothetical protein